MKAFKEFSIPIKTLEDGLHHFTFEIDGAFFSEFENSEIKEGKFTVELDFDKSSSLFVLDFEIIGSYKADCDRCLAKIDLALETEYQLLVKKTLEEEEDPDVICIDPEAHDINVAEELYEIIHLAIPMVKTIDCGPGEESFCDTEVLKKIQEEKIEEKENPLWDSLKDINFNKN
jgi:uncharacterized metal-binding protein YceD (DUF177 family)